MATTQSIPSFQAAVKKAATAVTEGEFEDARENAEIAVRQAGKQLDKAAGQVAQTAKKYPMASAGVVFGVGALVGALVSRLLTPKPSASEVLWDAIQRTSAQATKPLRSYFR